MATLAFSDQATQSTASPKPKWNFKTLIGDIKQYLNRYGWATDIETDPIELLKQAHIALVDQEVLNEKDADIDELDRLRQENIKLKAELASTKAKIPPWWRG